MKDQNIKKMLTEDLNLMWKTDEKTRNYIISIPRDKCTMEAEKIEYAKMS